MKNQRSTEVVDYMRALAQERSARSEEFGDHLLEKVNALEFMDDLAAALGICTSAEDWWDQSTDQKRAKLLGRAKTLRALAVNGPAE